LGLADRYDDSGQGIANPHEIERSRLILVINVEAGHLGVGDLQVLLASPLVESALDPSSPVFVVVAPISSTTSETVRRWTVAPVLGDAKHHVRWRFYSGILSGGLVDGVTGIQIGPCGQSVPNAARKSIFVAKKLSWRCAPPVGIETGHC
jgi:hypothetical protein